MQVIAAALLEDDAGLGDATCLASCAPLLSIVAAVVHHAARSAVHVNDAVGIRCVSPASLTRQNQ